MRILRGGSILIVKGWFSKNSMGWLTIDSIMDRSIRILGGGSILIVKGGSIGIPISRKNHHLRKSYSTV